VICLDSGCGNYEQLWSTASLRGLVSGDLTVSILREGVHSGDASGIVPSRFRKAETASGKQSALWCPRPLGQDQRCSRLGSSRTRASVIEDFARRCLRRTLVTLQRPLIEAAAFRNIAKYDEDADHLAFVYLTS